MNPPVAAAVETKSDEAAVEKQKYACGLCDTEVVYKIAQELLPGLASSCVDNTTGGLFKNAGSVAADMRKEMADYLTKRSETYVAEFLLNENASNQEISEHPYDIVIILIDDFSSSKRNMLSRVSEWVSSDKREDRIDDFVQEMEMTGFWLLPRREIIASVLLKNVDYKNSFHCNVVCESEEEVVKHRSECKFRPMDCTSEGCTTRYCVAHKEHHEAVCPFMLLPCEQKCSDFVMRREMDRHCVTVCPMKLVNCAFYTVGCQSSIPRCNVQQHNVDDLSSHLLFIIKTAHKEATDEDLKRRVEHIQKLSNKKKLAKARDARALTYLIKDAEAKLGPLDEPNTNLELPETILEDDSDSDSSTKKEQPPLLQSVDSPEKIINESPKKEEEMKKSFSSDEEKPKKSPKKEEEEMKKSFSSDEEKPKKSPKKEEGEEKPKNSPKKEKEEEEKPKNSPKKEEEKPKNSPKKEEEKPKKSPRKKKEEESKHSSSSDEEKPTKKDDERESFGTDEGESRVPSDTESWHSDV